MSFSRVDAWPSTARCGRTTLTLKASRGGTYTRDHHRDAGRGRAQGARDRDGQRLLDDGDAGRRRPSCRGRQVRYTLKLTPVGGFSGPVTLSISGLPGRDTVIYARNPAAAVQLADDHHHDVGPRRRGRPVVGAHQGRQRCAESQRHRRTHASNRAEIRRLRRRRMVNIWVPVADFPSPRARAAIASTVASNGRDDRGTSS